MTVKIWMCELCQLTSAIGKGWIRFRVDLQHGIPVENKSCPVELCPTCLELIRKHDKQLPTL